MPELVAAKVEGSIARFDPAIGRLVRFARASLRKRFPTAIELFYDRADALAMGFGPTERESDVIVSLGVHASGVSLYFTYGAALPDPERLLQGSGSQGRFIRLDRAAVMERPEVEALLRAAVRHASKPLPAAGGGNTVIKANSSGKRSRRPASS